MADADEGQQRPRVRETVDLIKSAICMHLRPSVPRSRPTVIWAVALMYLCAALRLVGVPLLPAVPGSIGHPLEIGISWGVFALLAWGNGRGHIWARLLFGMWFGLHSFALFYDLAHVSASAPPAWTAIASVVFWLVELAALLLILNKRSGPHHRREPARP